MRLPETRVLGAVIFDFDHTLTDFGRGVDWRRARDELVALYDATGIDTAAVTRARGSLTLIAALDAAVARRHSLERAYATRVEASRILERVELAGALHASFLPGAAAVLEEAGRAGLDLAIVSANAASAIRATLDRLGVLERFVVVVGRDPCRPLKPEPDMHREALRVLGCAAEAALGIGDSTNDVRAALAAGMLAVGVAGGESPPEELLAAGASFVLADLTAAPTLLALWRAAAEDAPPLP
ncbi:MAG: HAD family hydrolase [Deltaproteobacteria bacterium]|nr:HAD family hydrolase [Deltaproteobacteria bacterium]